MTFALAADTDPTLLDHPSRVAAVVPRIGDLKASGLEGLDIAGGNRQAARFSRRGDIVWPVFG